MLHTKEDRQRELKKDQLEAICRENNLNIGKTKAILVEIILNHFHFWVVPLNNNKDGEPIVFPRDKRWKRLGKIDDPTLLLLYQGFYNTMKRLIKGGIQSYNFTDRFIREKCKKNRPVYIFNRRVGINMDRHGNPITV